MSPNGMVTNSAVRMETADEIDFAVLKDGEALEYEAGMTFDEAGSYMIYPSQGTTVYLESTARTSGPCSISALSRDRFRDMGIYNAPQGYEIGRITLDGEAVTEGLDESGSWCYLAEGRGI